MDRAWWDKHFEEVDRVFVGERFTVNNMAGKFKTTWLRTNSFNAYGNSGAGCISLALHGESKRIVLIGYDCQKTGGMAHWHGDHPPGLGNAGSSDKWHAKFRELAKATAGAAVVNASRVTALESFPRIDLEEALCI